MFLREILKSGLLLVPVILQVARVISVGSADALQNGIAVNNAHKLAFMAYGFSNPFVRFMSNGSPSFVSLKVNSRSISLL